MFYVPYKFKKNLEKIAETGMREISWDIDKVGVTKCLVKNLIVFCSI